MARMVLQPTSILDGTGGPPLRDRVVTVVGERIESVIPADAFHPQPGDHVLDLPGMTLLPGLINCHVHLVLPGDNTPFVPWIDTQSDAALALRAAHNARTALHAGVTTVRDCGGRGTVVLDVRDALAEGLMEGAQVLSCGWPLTITGGHTRQFGGEADGEAALRTMVRRLVSLGADFIKVMAAGGGTPGSLPHYPSYSVAELRVIVETAHSLGRLVSAHCIATASILNAIEAEVDFIEHASFFGPEGVPRFDPVVADRLAAADIPVIPTLQVNRDMVEALPDGPERALWQLRLESQRAIVQHLHQLGVPLLAGSDAGWRATAFDTFWKELDELVVAGLSPSAAVAAATGNASRALGIGECYGTIKPGLVADLVAVEGDLSADIRCLSRVQVVIKRGRVIRIPREA